MRRADDHGKIHLRDMSTGMSEGAYRKYVTDASFLIMEEGTERKKTCPCVRRVI